MMTRETCDAPTVLIVSDESTSMVIVFPVRVSIGGGLPIPSACSLLMAGGLEVTAELGTGIWRRWKIQRLWSVHQVRIVSKDFFKPQDKSTS